MLRSTVVRFVVAMAMAAGCAGSSRVTTAGEGAANMTPDDPIHAVLARASSSDLASYDPRAVVEAVAALVPLGKEAALAAIEDVAVAAPAEPRQGLFLVLRVLFEAEPHPPMLLGASRPPPPAELGSIPRFPIALIDDAPILLVDGYTLRGLPQPVTDHVEHYRAHGRLRAAPLAPAAGVDRLAGYEALYLAAYGSAPSDAERAFVRAQLERAGY